MLTDLFAALAVSFAAETAPIRQAGLRFRRVFRRVSNAGPDKACDLHREDENFGERGIGIAV